ncbi:bacteriohemerythrin [uncultured Desulfuromonas sp.]|uniref:bacteriohemerythrin n=1 Tax=uncultured Desulfuromonas sp. TaxID=181013 RepID=UPI002AAAC8A2|nr:bacteriohemerythrin [uncultured Desulfuromonas sp.]
MADFIEWSDEISVGIQEIDEQHKKLVNLINRLYEAMTLGEDKVAVAKDVLNELVQYTIIHFAVEECLFRIFEYPNYRAHCDMHEDLRNQVDEINKKVQNGERLITPELLFFLRKWITNHIMVEDKKYSPFLLKKGMKKSLGSKFGLSKFWKHN